MSKFLDSIVNRLCTVLHGWTNADDEDLGDDIISIKRDIQQLGENARRMLEIGIVQDELVKLGFESPYFGTFSYYSHPETCMSQQRVVNVEFQNNFIRIADSSKECGSILYNNNYQQNILNKVKELIK